MSHLGYVTCEDGEGRFKTLACASPLNVAAAAVEVTQTLGPARYLPPQRLEQVAVLYLRLWNKRDAHHEQ